MISDVVSRKWIADVTSADETSIEVQAVFNRALRVEGLDAVIEQRNPQGTPWDPDCDEAPVLLVMSDKPSDELRHNPGVHGPVLARHPLRPARHPD